MRLILGDDRFEHFDLLEPLNEAPRDWSVLHNLYGAQRRLLRKEWQVDGKARRIDEKAASSRCMRLLASKSLSEEQQRALKALLKDHDPMALRVRVEAKFKAVYELSKTPERQQNPARRTVVRGRLQPSPISFKSQRPQWTTV